MRYILVASSFDKNKAILLCDAHAHADLPHLDNYVTDVWVAFRFIYIRITYIRIEENSRRDYINNY